MEGSVDVYSAFLAWRDKELEKANSEKQKAEMDAKASEQSTTSMRPAAIHKLEPEILCEIFATLRDASTSEYTALFTNVFGGRQWDWTQICHVCSYWRNTALEYPSLWSHFLNFRNITRTRIFLERSKSAKLVVLSRTSGADTETNIARLESFLMVLEHRDRIRYFDINLHIFPRLVPTWQKVQALLSQSLPRLSFIIFSVTSDSPSNPLPISLPECTPLITYLDLSDFSWPENASFPTGLLALKISSISGLTPSTFLSALKANPGLQELSIQNVRWNLASDSDSLPLLEKESVVSLPELVALNIVFKEDEKEGNEEISRLLRVPEKTNWFCSCTADSFAPLLDKDFFAGFNKKSLLCERVSLTIRLNSFKIQSLHRLYLNGGDSSNETTCSSTVLLRHESEESLSPEHAFLGVALVLDTLHLKNPKTVKISLNLGHWAIYREFIWLFPFLPLLPIQTLEVTIAEYSRSKTKSNTEIFLKTLTHTTHTKGGNMDPGDVVTFRNLEHLSLRLTEDAPNNLMGILEKGLDRMRQLGIRLKSFSFHTVYPICDAHEMLSHREEKISYTYDRANDEDEEY